jgi:hypothetical protein
MTSFFGIRKKAYCRAVDSKTCAETRANLRSAEGEPASQGRPSSMLRSLASNSGPAKNEYRWQYDDEAPGIYQCGAVEQEWTINGRSIGSEDFS